MRQTQTAVLERGAVLDAELATEPFEAAWASEARWFVEFLEPAPEGSVVLRTQISADGLTWVDHESPAIQCSASGIVTTSVHDFGHWLRLVALIDGATAAPLVRVYLALKE
ncbi:hypothetical protein [Humibacter sp. RRB41]|uniref:hypothetical protein n=1 Tax=Humibacter sp. RRB41 TaxID=2919946 RepID=UPI001FAA0DA5|nr:hypothetical protein [Humibacter sp. RRB41]